MRAQDANYKSMVMACWESNGATQKPTCKMMLGPIVLWQALWLLDHRPGHALDPCPFCKEEHRWALLRSLLSMSTAFLPDEQLQILLNLKGPRYDWLRNEYAYQQKEFPEGYLNYLKAAEAYFQSVRQKNGDAGNFYTL